MDHLPEVAALKAAMRATVTETGDPQRMHDAVCDLVNVLKVAGWPVEAIIVQVKKAAAEVGLSSTTHHGTLSGDSQTTGERVLQNAVRHCIEHYYKNE